MLLDGFIVGVESRLEEEDGGDAAGHFLNVADFVFGEDAAEKGLFAIGKPLLDDLVAADGVFPDLEWNVGPVGRVVEVDVASGITQLSQGLLLREAQERKSAGKLRKTSAGSSKRRNASLNFDSLCHDP